nr:uncharacterized protein K02A2.6-like [Parasteatoda tepidariorum]
MTNGWIPFMNWESKDTPNSFIGADVPANLIQRYFAVVIHWKSSHIGELHIVPAGCAAILGRQWIRALEIELLQIDANISNTSIHKSPVYQINPLNSLLEKFSPLFEERVGCVPHFQVSLQLRDGAKAIFTRERDVPYALRDRVNKELDSLEADGIISLVPASDWGSPLVVIPKPNGGVRLCVDYKCGVNERLIQSNHPVRRIDDVLHSLRNS